MHGYAVVCGILVILVAYVKAVVLYVALKEVKYGFVWRPGVSRSMAPQMQRRLSSTRVPTQLGLEVVDKRKEEKLARHRKAQSCETGYKTFPVYVPSLVFSSCVDRADGFQLLLLFATFQWTRVQGQDARGNRQDAPCAHP